MTFSLKFNIHHLRELTLIDFLLSNDGFGIQFSMDATMEFKNGYDIFEDLIGWPEDNNVSLRWDFLSFKNQIILLLSALPLTHRSPSLLVMLNL